MLRKLCCWWLGYHIPWPTEGASKCLRCGEIVIFPTEKLVFDPHSRDLPSSDAVEIMVRASK